MQSHQPVAIPQIIPVVLTKPVPALGYPATAPLVLAQKYFTDFSPALQSSVLRL
jgi:hypothetical protein